MVWIPTAVQAAPGSLDFSFGSGGIVVTPITNGAYTNGGYLHDIANSMVVQPDGKIVVCGMVDYSDDESGYPVSFFLARYNPTGTLDISFGINGKVVAPIGGFGGIYGGQGMALQPDGKIVTVGHSFGFGSSSFAVFRYNPNGTPDTSFGAGGIVTTPGTSGAYDVAVQPDGKIVVSGHARVPGQDNDFAVVRYNPNGSLDTSFGAGGKAIVPVGNGNAQSYTVALQTDGKIVVAGTSLIIGASYNFALIRLNADGSLDTGFGTNGKIIYSTPAGGDFRDVVVQPDGKIVAAGGKFSGRTAIFRFNTNGSIDTSFAANGIFTTEFGFYVGNSVALQPDGKIVAFGHGQTTGSGLHGFAVERLNPNGSPDASFGVNGRMTTLIGTYSNSEATAGALQSDGKILAFGRTGTPSYNEVIDDIAIVRYLDDFAASRPTKFDFDGDGRADISVFRPSDRTWYVNGSNVGFAATQFGLATDEITPADFDGDGKTDIAIFRDGVWFWINSSNGVFRQAGLGVAGDTPVPADYNGDGRGELAVYRGGTWFTYDIATGMARSEKFGIATDRPVPADYDGDGRTDYAVYRNGVWYLSRSTDGFAAFQFGLPTDKLVPSDYDGDEKTDLAVYRDGTWYLQRSMLGFTAFQFGAPTDTPVPADYDGNGRADAAVFRNGVWYLQQGTGGFATIPFGLTDDKPVPAAYLP